MAVAETQLVEAQRAAAESGAELGVTPEEAQRSEAVDDVQREARERGDLTAAASMVGASGAADGQSAGRATGARLSATVPSTVADKAQIEYAAATYRQSGRRKRLEDYGVQLVRVRALRGPNVYAFMPVLKATIDIGPYEDKPSSDFPGFAERLADWLPGLDEHECSLGKRGGFLTRMKRGTYLAHITEHVALELLQEMGFYASYGRVRGTGERGLYDVVIEYKEEEPSRAAFDSALRITLAAMHDDPFDIRDELDWLRDLADDHKLGPSTEAILEAARKRDIPTLRLTPTASLIQLGYGVHQKRVRASETSNTSAIAVDLCQDKLQTNALLRAVGAPVPEGETVKSAKEAWAVAQDLGLPVVCKPEAGNQGRGVTVNLWTEEEVKEAFELAEEQDRGDVLVEQHIEGADHRLLVINGKLVAAAKREPAHVVGDGQSTIEQLVRKANRDPRRGVGHGSALTRLKLDRPAEAMLEKQGYTPDSVPEAGEKVLLRSNANLSTGGTATDVTDEVHPRNAAIAILAAKVLGMDIAGIDILCKDISRPLRDQRGAICEVNAAPGLRMHIHPSYGQGRDVGTPIMDMLYPPDAKNGKGNGRIPIIAITGTNGKTTVTRLIGHMFEVGKFVVGMTCTDGTYINGERLVKGDNSGPRSARSVLLHPSVEVAVLETARGGILREGLAFDGCSVGVVTNVSPDHLGMGGIETLEDLQRVKQVVVENVRPDGVAVLNAEDPLVAEMAAVNDGETIFFSANPNNPIVQAHMNDGCRCVIVEEGQIVLVSDNEKTPLVPLERVRFTAEGKIPFQVQNALAAVGAAWGAGLNPVMISRGLTTFETDTETAPGRFNVQDMHGVEVIFDYGHNVGGMKAMGEAVHAMGDRKTVMTLGLPGDRKDEDLRQTIQATADFVDEYVVYDQHDRRGRKEREVPELLAAAIKEVAPEKTVHLEEDQETGICAAWKLVSEGDRLIVIADEVDEGIELVQALATRGAEETPCSAPIKDNGNGSKEHNGHNGNGNGEARKAA